jgi:hypothetical protein
MAGQLRQLSPRTTQGGSQRLAAKKQVSYPNNHIKSYLRRQKSTMRPNGHTKIRAALLNFITRKAKAVGAIKAGKRSTRAIDEGEFTSFQDKKRINYINTSSKSEEALLEIESRKDALRLIFVSSRLRPSLTQWCIREILAIASTLTSIDEFQNLLDFLGTPISLQPLVRMRFSQNLEKKEMMESYIVKIDWKIFRERRDKLKIYDEGFSEKASPIAAKCARTLSLIAESSKECFQYSESSYYDAFSISNLLRRSIEEKKATSFILNFNENLLNNDSANTVGKIFKLRKESIHRADFLGFPTINNICNMSLSEGGMKRLVRTSESLDEFVGSQQFGASYIVSSSANRHLQRWNLFAYILEGIEEISVISCQDSFDIIPFWFGKKLKNYHQLTNDIFRDPVDEDMLIRFLDSIMVVPGEVYLVGAGGCSSIVCDKIKQLSGIGIDVGNLFEFWTDHINKKRELNTFRFDVRSSYIFGFDVLNKPFARTASPIINSVTNLSLSDMSRSGDVINEVKNPENFIKQPKLRRKNQKLLIIGHPRCASGFISHYLKTCGLDVGHEGVGADGTCSWVLAPNDLNPPWSQSPITVPTADILLGYVRDPFDAIPSIELENMVANSYSYRRFHILKNFGIDLDRYENSIDRAAASYIYWNDMLERRSPLKILRIEHLQQDLIEIQNILKQKSQIHLDFGNFSDKISGVNNSVDKFQRKKQLMSKARLDEMSGYLRTELEKRCLRYGYEVRY